MQWQFLKQDHDMARPLAGFCISCFLGRRIDADGFTFGVQYDDTILDDTFMSQI